MVKYVCTYIKNSVLCNFLAILILQQFSRMLLLFGVFFVGQTSNDLQTHKSFDISKMVPISLIPILQATAYSILSHFEATLILLLLLLITTSIRRGDAVEGLQYYLLQFSLLKVGVTINYLLLIVNCQ